MFLYRLLHWLRAPFPSLCQPWKAVVYSTLIIFIILALFRPFGIAQSGSKQWLFIMGSTLSSALCTALFAYVLPWIFPEWHAERHWTVGRHILQQMGMLLCIAVGVWGFNCWVFGMLLNWRFLVLCVGWVILLAPFPTAIFLFWNQNLLLKRNLQDAMSMNEALLKRLDALPKESNQATQAAKEEMQEQQLLLTGDTRDSQLTLLPSQLLYAESCSNYVKVVWLAEGAHEAQSRLLRLTMKQLEEQVMPYDVLTRCHRAYLVNLRQVKQVSGNSQGCQLRLSACEETVPMSRSYVKKVKDALLQ
ncbi:MAG: LytR/AlgR family response regulator transcription factor [Bacteroides sp.]